MDKHSFPVVLTFDVDGETLWTSRDAKNWDKMVTLSQGQYGPKVAVPRILKLLDRYDIKATFFIPGYIMDTYPDMAMSVHKAGHEIAHHGYLHEWPETFASEEEECTAFEKAIASIEKVTGYKPVGYRSPAWEFSPWTLKLLQEHNILYSANMMDDDGPYMHHNLVELPVQWCLDDAAFWLYSTKIPGKSIQPLSNVYEYWTSEFDGLYHEEGKCMVLTLHPQVIGRPGRMKMLEELIQFMKGYPDVLFTTGRELATYVAANYGK